jgi:signal transduction histidine kinase/ligand-binding sensor domain-containing protein
MPAEAQDRLHRVLGEDQGLAAPPVWALAQDSTGFLWIGAEGGLYRYDGTEVVRWAPATVEDPVDGVTVSGDGRIAIRDRRGRVFEVTPQGAHALPPLPIAGRPDAFNSSAYDSQGRLWVLRAGTVVYLDPGDGWRALPRQALEGDRVRRLRSSANGGVDIATDGGVWRVTPGGQPRRVFSGPPVLDLRWARDGRLLLLTAGEETGTHGLLEVVDGRARELLSPGAVPYGRPVSLTERNGTVWISFDRFLVAVRPGRRPEVLTQASGIESGGPLLVDREGSLWLGTYAGLLQFPEPDTRLWGEREGLRSRHARFLARTGNTIWVSTWAGLSYLRQDPDGWAGRPVPWWSRSRLCTDGRGAVWLGADDGLVEVRDTAATRWPGPPVGGMYGCTAAPDGGVWIGTAAGLRYADPERRSIRDIPAPPGLAPGEPLAAALHDSHDRLWAGTRDAICRAPVTRLLAGEVGAWHCDRLPDLGFLPRMAELPGGTIWAARGDLFAFRDEWWEPLPMDGLTTRTAFGLVPSPRGGVWVTGHGILERVRESRDGGWETVERLTPWHGLQTGGGQDLLEEEDGTVWIASSRGVNQVPAAVRFAEPDIPPVALVEARAGDRPVQPGEALRLPHSRSGVELRFAALSYRDPSRLRHQVRLGPDDAWSESMGRPSFRWVGLAPGRYQVEYRASLDGLNWSTEPLRFAFEVRPPWYRTSWFMALGLAVAAGLGWIAYRARVAYLLGLERQRTRIAMDLHDQVGSGLASVGILSGVLAADSVPADERRAMAAEIASAAEELGSALSDIVWSLDPGVATLEELAARLAEHGERLCPNGAPAFSARFPARWPPRPLDASLRTGLLLIGLEALHNAVRHSAARTVTLSILPARHRGWRLTVADDGIGFVPDRDIAAGTGNRHGLRGMHRRAAEIGADLQIQARPGHGTAVHLRFALDRAPHPGRPGLAGRLRRLTSPGIT